MAITDTASGDLTAAGRITLARAGEITGRDSYMIALAQALTDGAGRNQISIALKGTDVSVPTAFTAIDLSSGTDPFGSMDDAVPSSTGVAGTSIRVLFIHNKSTSGTITIGASGANGMTGIWSTQGSALLEGDRIPAQSWDFKFISVSSGTTIDAAGTRNLTINAQSAGTTCDILIGLG